MDRFDRAEQLEEAERQSAIDNRVQYLGESAKSCECCEGPIPEGRRQAIPGVSLCIDCQEREE